MEHRETVTAYAWTEPALWSSLSESLWGRQHTTSDAGKGRYWMNWMQSVVARSHDDESGMTLIELLVVILILGILAAIVVVGIGAFQNTGDTEACKTTVGEVESANAAYYAKNQAWPNDIALLVGANNYLKTTPKASWGISVNGATVSNTCP